MSADGTPADAQAGPESDRGPDDLFRSLLFAPDREACPGVNPVLSWREDDDPDYLGEIEHYGVAHYELERRGAWHGRWTELEGAKLMPRVPRGRQLHAALQRRWHAAEPVVLRRVLDTQWRDVRQHADERVRWFRRLTAADDTAAALKAELSTALARTKFSVGAQHDALSDPDRDITRFAIEREKHSSAQLWAKLARLSTWPGDESLRLRFSFGEEGADDASHDDDRHELVRKLAQHALPETAGIASEKSLTERIDRLCGEPTFFTQHIAYWNAPGGGALFHHDSFEEEHEERQRGVAYVQLTGRTAWLALSIESLAARTQEFLEILADPEMEWLRSELFATAELDDLQGELDSLEALTEELALPGCGRLSALVNRGPEFTSLLADAGHGFVLRPGDAILLPNHGLAATAMHSVFCASPETTYGVSMAIRRKASR